MPTGKRTKLTLVTHGITEAIRAARFPLDEPLIAPATAFEFPRADYFATAPELRTRQTAGNGSAVIDPELRDLDCGEWAGNSLDAVDPLDLHRWLTDPDAAPHGGECVSQLCRRVEAWLDACARRGGRTVAVTHPAVVRAAVVTTLGAPASSFWRVDVPPATQTRFRCGAAWTVRIGA